MKKIYEENLFNKIKNQFSENVKNYSFNYL